MTADIGIDSPSIGEWLRSAASTGARTIARSRQHEVTLSQEELTRYMASNTSVSCARLARHSCPCSSDEPKESILRSFALSDIER